MKYQIVIGASEGGLMKNVAHFIDGGWEPIGGVAVAIAPNMSHSFYQAMVLSRRREAIFNPAAD